MNDSFYNTCADIIGPEHVDADIDPPVCSPPDINVCAELFRHIHASRLPVAIKGGGTFPAPSPEQNQVVISTSAMHAVREVSEYDFVLVSGSGAAPDKALELARIAGFTFPLDCLYGDRATLGGLFMSGAVVPGMSDTKPFIRSVLGVRGVAANGDIVTFGGRVKKNVTGYEVTRFLAGSMGLFMLACELVIALHPTPDRRTVVSARFHSGRDTLAAVRDILQNAALAPYLMECVLPDGLEQSSTLMTGFSGSRIVVERQIKKTTEILERNGADALTNMRDDEAFKIRGEQTIDRTFDRMVSCYMPQSAVVPFLGRFMTTAVSLPLVVYPLDGIVHTVAGNDVFSSDNLRSRVLAVGGKQAVYWDDVRRNGIGGMLNLSEKAFVQKMKTELDPDGLLNRHMGLT